MTDAGRVTAADFDALEDVLRRWVATAKERSLQSRAFKEAATAWVEEASVAEGITELFAAELRHAERLRPVADAVTELSHEYVAALGAVDLGVTECLRRAAKEGIEPADEADIRQGFAGMTQLAALSRGQLDVLAGLEARTVDQFRRRDVQQSLDRIFAATRLMEEQQPVLDEWERLIQLIPFGD